MFSYAFPIMLTGLAGMTNEMFSRITLEWWLPKNFYPGQSDEYALGIFGACYKYAVLMNLAIQAFRFAGEPFFFSNAADKNSPELFAKVNHYFIIVCCLLLLGVGINLDILKVLTDEQYWVGLNIVPILLLGYLFLGIYYNLSAWFKLTDKTHYGTIISIGGAVVTILANYLLIPIAGYLGSSFATVICYFLMAATCYILGQKFYPIPYKVTAGMAYIIVTIILVYFVNSIKIDNQFLALGFHGIIIIAYLAIAYLIEKAELKKALGSQTS
jgi:O-antigen/teichoic acid export membrane protein